MRNITFVAILVLVVLIASGCSGKDNQSTPNSTNKPEPQANIKYQNGNKISEPEDDSQSIPINTNKSEQQSSMIDQNGNTISSDIYGVQLWYPLNIIHPSELNINAGESVSWSVGTHWRSNMKDSSVHYVLISKEGLFPDKELTSNKTYCYTFSNPGTYHFYVKDIPNMCMNITVHESSLSEES